MARGVNSAKRVSNNSRFLNFNIGEVALTRFD